MPDIIPAAPSKVQTLIATVPTFLRAAENLEEPVKVELGARLVAVIRYAEPPMSWIVQGSVDGQPLADHICFFEAAHWTVLPDPRRDAPPGLDTSTGLTANLLTSARWRFGDAGKAPWTSNFLFERDGRIVGKSGPNHRKWRLENGWLSIFTETGRLSWITESVETEDGTILVNGFGLLNAGAGKHVVLKAVAPRMAEPPHVEAPVNEALESVRLVIWDLDDTFWTGTLAEGGIKPVPAHIELLKTLSARGIVNSICSKNEFSRTKAELMALSVWDYFIFPRIDFVPKGAMIKDIITAVQLRTSSVLFIDDNSININEALHYNPGLQVCLPDAIAGLLADPRLKGKPDADMKRLANYKVLESKAADKTGAATDNMAFLRQSGIKISFHHDIMAEFPRIHDLVNRTNQLNFTKKRWPEDIEEAKIVFQAEFDSEFNSHPGYVKVADKYGNYGIVGFYMTRRRNCPHFLFSCRTLNMGIEQFVWQRLGRPNVNIEGEVVAKLGDAPDWITVVDDADDTDVIAGGAERLSICLRGACDLSMMTHYLRARYDTTEEFPYPYKGWSIYPVARAAVLYEEATSSAGSALLSRMPGMPEACFRSRINDGDADVYILSFSSEVFPAMHLSRSTGMILPLNNSWTRNAAFSSVDYAEIAERASKMGTTAAHWQFLQEEFTHHSVLSESLLAADVELIFRKLRDKMVIVLTLNTLVGSNQWVLKSFSKINAVVLPLAREFGCDIIDVNEFVTTTDDLIAPDSNGAHFRRDTYRKLADRVSQIIAAKGSSTATTLCNQVVQTNACQLVVV